MVNFCPKCGEYIIEDDQFCVKCGFDLTERKIIEKQVKKDKKGKPIISGNYGEYAGFWRRFSAFIIDSIITGIINGIFWINVQFYKFSRTPPYITAINQDLQNINIVTGILISFLYWWIFESYRGQSLGKIICRIKTVDIKTLETATVGSNAINNLLKVWGPTFLLDLIIGVFVNSGEPEKRLRIAQNWSKTIVIKV